MDTDNPNEVLEALDEMIVRHERGSSISAEDLRRLRGMVTETRLARESGPQPRTMEQARALARRSLIESPSAVEGVKG